MKWKTLKKNICTMVSNLRLPNSSPQLLNWEDVAIGQLVRCEWGDSGESITCLKTYSQIVSLDCPCFTWIKKDGPIILEIYPIGTSVTYTSRK